MDLIGWQKAVDLVTEIYRLTRRLLRKRFLVSPVNFARPRFQFPAILQMGKADFKGRISRILGKRQRIIIRIGNPNLNSQKFGIYQ
jgi:hypothetical protein